LPKKVFSKTSSIDEVREKVIAKAEELAGKVKSANCFTALEDDLYKK